jgi:hypothetical protein
MKLRKLFHVSKHRKYPIKRDEEGQSLRSRSFRLFELGKRPVEATEELKMEKATAFRYFQQWKRIGPNFERRYTYVRGLFDKKNPDRDKNIEIYSGSLKIKKEELEKILSTPHGLQRLMTKKLYLQAYADADHKRHVMLELALLMSDFLIKEGGKLEDIYLALKHYMPEAMKYHQKEDANIEERNQWMGLVHKILAADIENERKGRVKPDTFSEKERNTLIKLGLEKEKLNLEMIYLLRIGALMAGGLTEEEACEQIYQEMLKKGDSRTAKMAREFQGRLHPVKPDT